MAIQTGAMWVTPPSALAQAFAQYGERVVQAVDALAMYLAERIQSDMRSSAPWTDRTGNARSGLFSVAERAAGDVVTIWLSHGHTVDYGKWLELANGGKYAVIMPTLERWLPEIERMLKQLFAD
jgi:hypothetical protein